MFSLMRRNNIFLSHGGSSLLTNRKKVSRDKNTFQVTSVQGDGSFAKLYLPGEDAWVKCGMFVLYKGGTRGGDVARLLEFHLGIQLGTVYVKMQKCRFVESASVLSRHTQCWEMKGGVGSIVSLTLSVENDHGIELYPMQRDFTNNDRFYSCPYMRTIG